jgi:SNF2 family DNA or RNA helicase
MRAVGLFRGGTKKKKRRIHNESLPLSQRDINVRDMINNSIKVTRKPVLSFLGGTSLALSKKLTRPFKSPCLHLRTDESDTLLKTKKLGMTAFRPHKMQTATNRRYEKKTTVKNDDVTLIDPSKRLIVYEKEDLVVEVPHILANVLREHQREGVRFLFACVAGVSISPFSGAILADDMGL